MSISMKTLPSWLRWVCGGLIGLIVIGLISLVVVYWEWFVTVTPCRESGSTTVRNLGLVLGGFIAIGIAVWRGVVADRQARASQQQAEVSQRVLLNERYQKGLDMLSSKNLSDRLGGIDALMDLAEDEPEQYHVKVKRRLCAFVCHPAKGEDDDGRLPVMGKSVTKTVRADIQHALSAIGSHTRYVEIKVEKEAGFHINLAGADLAGANLLGAFLSKSDLNYANLTGANLILTELIEAFLLSVNLTGANLTGANLTDTNLSYANLTAAVFSEVKGLTQEQLDQARADPARPPKLDGVQDAKTGAPLKWSGKPCS